MCDLIFGHPFIIKNSRYVILIWNIMYIQCCFPICVFWVRNFSLIENLWIETESLPTSNSLTVCPVKLGKSVNQEESSFGILEFEVFKKNMKWWIYKIVNWEVTLYQTFGPLAINYLSTDLFQYNWKIQVIAYIDHQKC